MNEQGLRAFLWARFCLKIQLIFDWISCYSYNFHAFIISFFWAQVSFKNLLIKGFSLDFWIVLAVTFNIFPSFDRVVSCGSWGLFSSILEGSESKFREWRTLKPMEGTEGFLFSLWLLGWAIEICVVWWLSCLQLSSATEIYTSGWMMLKRKRKKEKETTFWIINLFI